MSFNLNNDWAMPAKGNWWRRTDGTALTVGIARNCWIWERVDEDFLDDQYDSLSDTQATCEEEI